MYAWLNRDGQTVLETKSDALSASTSFLMMGEPTDEAVLAILRLAETALSPEQEKAVPEIVAVQVAGGSVSLQDAFTRVKQDAVLAAYAGPGAAAEHRQKLEVMARRFPQSLPG